MSYPDSKISGKINNSNSNHKKQIKQTSVIRNSNVNFSAEITITLIYIHCFKKMDRNLDLMSSIRKEAIKAF